MNVLHGVCTKHEERKGERTNTKTGEVKAWRMPLAFIFTGESTVECTVSDGYGGSGPDGRPSIGDVVTALVDVTGYYRDAPTMRLVSECDGPSVTTAFTPEVAALVLAMRGGVADSKPVRAA